MTQDPAPFTVGQRVFFRTRRDSSGWGVIRAIRADRPLIDPAADAVKGRDYWQLTPAAAAQCGRSDYWGPRDRGIRLHLGPIRDPLFPPDHLTYMPDLRSRLLSSLGAIPVSQVLERETEAAVRGRQMLSAGAADIPVVWEPKGRS